MSEANPEPRQERLTRAEPTVTGLQPEERNRWALRFGVAPTQIDHVHVISHLREDRRLDGHHV